MKAKRANQMIRCIVELTPLCNLSCEMCGISLHAHEISRYGRMLTYDEWTSLLCQLAEYGVLHLCMSGGEPLMHPNFAAIYEFAYKRGFLIEIRTNGMLLPAYAELFRQMPPQQIGISIYGSTNEMYGRMTGDEQGFERLLSGLESIKAIPSRLHFTCTMTKTNVACFYRVAELAVQYHAGFGMITDIFPHVRGKNDNIRTRLSPAECASLAFYPPRQIEKALEIARMLEMEFGDKFDRELMDQRSTLTVCTGCQIEGCIKWDGRLSFCPEIDTVYTDPLRNGIRAAWSELLQKRDLYLRPSAVCERCGIRRYCRGACPARFLLETGNDQEPCEVICRTAFFSKILHQREEWHP